MSISYLDDTVLDPAEMDVTDVVSILFPWTNGRVLFFPPLSAPTDGTTQWKNCLDLTKHDHGFVYSLYTRYPSQN